MNNLFTKKTVVELLIILLLSLIPLLWFRPGMMMLGHDNVFPINPKVFLEGRLSTWVDHGFGQNQSLIMGTIPIHFIDALPSFLGFSVIDSQKIVYVFWFFAMTISMYILARVLNKESMVFRLTMVVCYVFNFFILQGWWIGERTKFSAYAAFPLVLAVFIQVWRGNLGAVTGGLLTGFIFSLFNAGGLYGIPLYGGLFVAIFAFILFVILTSIRAKVWQPFRRIIRLLIVSLCSFVLVNAYFLLPAVVQVSSKVATTISQNGGVSGLIEWASEISASTSFLNLMRLQGIAEWYDNPEHPYAQYYLTNPVLITLSFLWPLLVLFAVSKLKHEKEKTIIFFFFFVYLLGLFFSAGTHAPLGFIYKLFLKYVPGFIIFRSPYFKFAPAIFLSLSVLIAYLMDSLRGKWKYTLWVSFLVFVLVYHFPYFTGNIFGWRQGFSTRLSVPSYVSDFGNWINGNTADSERILVVPPNSSQFSYSRYAWGYLSFQSLPTLVSNKPVVINNDRVTHEENILLMALYDSLRSRDYPMFNKLSSLLSVSYVLLQKDAADSQAKTDTKAILEFAGSLTNTDIFAYENTFGQWDLYRIKVPRQTLLYTDNQLLSLTTDIDQLSSYYSYFSDLPTVVLESDKPRLDIFSEDDSVVRDVFVPTCLNCPYSNLPVIQFPERNILPDSPFFPLILALESRKVRNITDPKSQIYSNLGLSLKRISELNELIIHNKPMTKSFLELIRTELTDIQNQFNRIVSLEDKITIARDINHYIRAERSYLRPNLGSYITRGEQTVLIGEVFSAMSGVEQTIRPFIAAFDESAGRAYQITIRSEGDYKILLRRNSINEIEEKRDPSISITIDNGKPIPLSVSEVADGNVWLQFNPQRLSKGLHVLKLALPQPANTAYALNESVTEFTKDGENRCFSVKFHDFFPSRVYKAEVSYVNNFSDNLLMFIWEYDGTKRRLIDASKLNTSGLKEKVESIIKPQDGTEGVELALCAPNLTEDIIRNQFTVNISEVHYPSLLIHQTRLPRAERSQVTYEKMSPTKYRIHIPNVADRPLVFIFSSRFDAGWKLSGYENTHFRANGYANGWVLKNTNQKDFILEFQPQKYYWNGILISIFFVGFAIIYTIFREINGK